MNDLPDPPDLQSAPEDLKRVTDLLDHISRLREANHIVSVVLSELVRMTDASRGVLSVAAKSEGGQTIDVVRDCREGQGALPQDLYEMLYGWVLRHKVPLRVADLDSDARFRSLSSHGGHFKSVLSVPLIARDEVTGVATLVRDAAAGTFSEAHGHLAGIICAHTAQVLSNALLRTELAQNQALLQESQRRLQEDDVRIRSDTRERFALEEIVGGSDAMNAVRRLISKVCGDDMPVLICGPTGTGKELVARAIHFNSPRRDRPFVVKNCGVKTETLLEAELFGHAKGAFTGADRPRPGLFREADGGTIFLDEVGDAPPSTQAALLRVLETGEIRPVGASREEHVNVRVLSATNKDLAAAMQAGELRSDLYYRLNAVTIRMPALAERPDDIPVLAEHFLALQRARLHNDELALTPAALDALKRHAWPGNVRELENEIARAALFCDLDGQIDVVDLSEAITGGQAGRAPLPGDPYRGELRAAVETVERDMIARALQETNGNILQTSKRLGLTRKGLKDKMTRYGMRADDARTE